MQGLAWGRRGPRGAECYGGASRQASSGEAVEHPEGACGQGARLWMTDAASVGDRIDSHIDL